MRPAARSTPKHKWPARSSHLPTGLEITTRKELTSMSQTTQLASGHIHLSDEITVELVSPNGWPSADPDAVTEEPAKIRIIWPPHSTITTAGKFAEVAAAAVKVLANASTELSR